MMARLSYRYEMRAALTFPLAASLAEGSFTSVVAAKNFGASIILMSVIAAAPMFGNIIAMMWSEIAIGRRKVPLVNMLQGGVVLMIASVALDVLLPPAWAGWIFASQIVAARLLASGITTIRAAIWRANYPRTLRGHVVSRISTVSTAVLAATTLVGSRLLDHDAWAYVYLYPSAAMLGVIGIWQFSKIRVRQEPAMCRREEEMLGRGFGRIAPAAEKTLASDYVARPENLSDTDEANVLNYVTPDPEHRQPRWLRRMFLQAWDVLRRDKDFRDYQRWQFLSGMSFMMFQPALLFMVSRQMTDPRHEYLLATTVVQIIPMIFSIVFAPLWAPFFDRVHITRFRVAQMSVALGVHVTILAGAIIAFNVSPLWGLAVVALGQALVGISNGAGNLAWNLGHNDYASTEDAAKYMAVHVMLTGVRGCLAPFFGSFIYQALGGRGYLLFVISGATCLVSLLGFRSMAKRAPAKHAVPAQ